MNARGEAQVLSYGGGLDSFAMLVDAVQRGERPDVCVFMNVGDPEGLDPGEWPSTYRHMREVAAPLCAREGIEWVTLEGDQWPVRNARSLWAWLEARNQIPVSGPNRICTTIAKVERFEKWLDARWPGQEVEVWIGYEAGEEGRAANDPNQGGKRKLRPGASRRVNRFPLIERGLCRCRCRDLVRAAGHPVPRKSACVFCLTGDTEVVTRGGIRPIAELAGGRHTLLVPQVGKLGGLAHRGTFREVEVRAFGRQLVWEVKLRRMRSTKVVRTTAEHRWFHVGKSQWAPMREYVCTTDHLKVGDRLRLLRASPPVKEKLMAVAVAQGFTFGDGSHGAADERPASVTIYHVGKDGAVLPYFAGCEAKPSEGNGKPCLRLYGLPRFWKQFPPLSESRSFLLSWLAGYFAADGAVSKRGQAVCETPRRDVITFVRSVAAVCGVGYTPMRSRKRKGFLRRPGRVYRAGLRLADLPPWFFIIEQHRKNAEALVRSVHDAPWVVESVRRTKRIEEVFCAVVPGAGAFGLADDLMTGNCPYSQKQDWQTLQRERPDLFQRVVDLEANKPVTGNGKKLSIMGYRKLTVVPKRTSLVVLRDNDGVSYVAPPLTEYVKGAAKPEATKCKVCGQLRSSKATGCDYLEDAAA